MEIFFLLCIKFFFFLVYIEVYIKCFENIYINVFYGVEGIYDIDDEF